MYYIENHLIRKDEREFICIHTGGIQAWNGYFFRFPELRSSLRGIYNKVNELLEEKD